MRKLMWFTIGFACSCVLGAYWMSADNQIMLALVSAVAAAIGWLISKKVNKQPVISLFLIGMSIGMAWFWAYDGYYLKPIAQLDGVTTDAVIEAVDYSYDTDYGSAVDGISTWNGKSVRLKVYLNGYGLRLNPGDEIRGTFRFRITNDGGEKEPTYHRGRGITLIASQAGDCHVNQAVTPLWMYPAAFVRNLLHDNLLNSFPVDTADFAVALLLGDSSGLDYETETSFKVSGIRHIIAVSGLHISILFSLVYLMAGKDRILTAVVGIPILGFFAMVAGLSPSVIRACIMHSLMMLAMLLNREYDPLTALSFSALVMLAVNPIVITDVGFQLSFACMLGILLYATKIKDWLLHDDRLGHSKGKSGKARLVRWLAGSVSVSLSSMVFSVPLSALHFGTVSLVGVLTNLLTLWVVTGVFYGILLTSLLSLFWHTAAMGLAWVVSWLIRYILALSRLLASFPLAAVYTRSNYILIWLAGCYILFGLLLIMKRKRPVMFGCIGVLGLCAALLISWLLPLRDDCRVTVLDVGQGQSIILQSKNYTFLVDCGGDYDDSAADIAAETLISQGITRLDGLIVTHYDADHAGGVDELLTRIQVDNLFLPAYEPQTELSRKLLSFHNGRAYQVNKHMELTAGDAKLTIMTSLDHNGGNESSLCVLFQAGNCDILITGDRTELGEKLLMKQIALPKLELLVVGHHGAKDSTCQELLDAVSPRISVISAGKYNRYGHPHETVLQRLEDSGTMILRTDADGTIIFRGMTHGEENGTTE